MRGHLCDKCDTDEICEKLRLAICVDLLRDGKNRLIHNSCSEENKKRWPLSKDRTEIDVSLMFH